MSRLILFIILVLIPIIGFSQQSIQECAKIESDIERLSCFDSLVKSEPLHDIEKEWIVKQDDDPLNDSRIVTLVNVSEQGESSFGRPIILVLRCAGNATDMYIGWQDYLGSDNIRVTHRVGKDEAESLMWSLSTDNEATFYPRNVQKHLLRMIEIEQSSSGQQFVARTTPYNESPTTAIWNLDGLAEAIVPLREACGW